MIKSDEHRFYRYLSGSGLKGVDFMGLVDEQLILIEVKNYEDRFNKDGHSPATAILDQPQFYAEKFVQKFTDSFRLIRIVQQHHQRQFWYRLLYPLFKRFPIFRFKQSDWYFWSKAFQILESSPKNVQLWLWLEMGSGTQAKDQNSLEDQLYKFIKGQFDGDPYQICIHNHKQTSTTMGIQVRLNSKEKT